MSSADRTGLIVVSANWLRTWPRRYGFAVLLVAVATVVRYALIVTLGPLPPFVIFLPAIILVAVLAGFGPGVLATVLSAASVASFFWTSLNVFGSSRLREAVGLILFCGVGTGISGLGRLYRSHESRMLEFERVAEGLEGMVVVIDRDYRYLMANRAFLNYRGMKREELVGHRIPEILNPGVFESTVKSKVDECFRGKIVQYEMRYCYPNRGVRDLVISYFPLEGPRGIDRLTCVLRDVTDRKHAEESLHESEDRYRDLVEHSEDLVCTHDLRGKLLSVNPAPARVLGYEVSELLQMPMRELIAPDFREQFDLYLERIRTKGADQGLLCVLTRSGERRIWEYRNTLRTEDVPEPIVRGMAHDVTERKRAESALRTSEQRYRLLFEKNIAGVAIASLDGQILDCNDAWARILGYDSAREIQGHHASEFYFDLAERGPLREQLERTGVFLAREIQLRRKDGSGVWVLFDCALRLSEDGQPILQSAAIDITERKKAEEALCDSELRYRTLFEKTNRRSGDH